MVSSADNKALSAAVSGQAVAKPRTLRDWVLKSQPQFEKALGQVMSSDRFCRILMTQVQTNKSLAKAANANPTAFIGAAMEMAQLGLDPAIPNEAFFVPYKDRTTCQPGYKGLMKLAVNAANQSGDPFEIFSAEPIHENDVYERELGSNRVVRHTPPKFGSERGQVIGFVAIAKTRGGLLNFVDMTANDVQAHYERFCKSKANPNSPWSDKRNFPRYGCKTVVRLLCNRHLTMDAKLSKALELDDDQAEAPDVTVETEQAVEPEVIQNQSELTEGQEADAALEGLNL